MTSPEAKAAAGGRGVPARILVVLAALALVALPFSAALLRAQPGKEVVADVIITGARTIAPEKVMRYIHTRKGMEYSSSRMYDDIKRLTETRLFKNVAPRVEPTADGRVIVYYDLTEHQNSVREVIYKHAKHISDKELENITHIRKGMPLDRTLNQLAVYEIQEYFKKKGRYFANVTLEEGFDESHTRVVFNITEGPIVRIRSINFTGNALLATSDRLRTQLDSGTAFLGALGGVFNPTLIDQDVLKLEAYYRSNGFLNARVARELIFTHDHTMVDILFHIREGDRFRVKDVAIEGTNHFSKEQLASYTQVKKGEYFNENTVDNDVRNLTDFGGWRGYQLRVDKQVYSVPNEPGVVNVQYTVQEPQVPAKVGQVIIVGNEVTQDRIIRRVIGLYPGQTLRYPELRIAERDLQRLSIFDTNPELGIRPTITVLDDPNNPSEFKDVLVQVKEAHTGSLMLGAGVNSSSGLVGSIVLNEKNFDITRVPTSFADILEGRAFRGAGQEFRIEAVPGTQLQRYSATFREPFLFDRPYSLTLSGYYFQRAFNEYTEEREGGRITIGHQFNKAWSINAGGRIENVNVSNVAFNEPIDYTSVVGDNLVIGPRVGLTRDTRDSYLRATAGNLFDISYEQVFGTFNFPIFNADFSQYWTVFQRPDGSGKQVLLARGQVGIEGNNAPVFERFFAGGYQSLRGFAFRGVGPEINGYEIGGTFLLLNSLEYQVPIRANDSLYAVAFLDGGTVERNVSLHNYNVSAGVGLRITVPMLGPVPIALDLGFPINRAPGTHEQVFQFYFGAYR